MKKLIFIGIIVIIIGGGVSIYQNLVEKPEISPEDKSMAEKTLEGKKIAIIVAFRDFRDEEYFVPKEILEGAGAEIKNASNKIGKAIGVDGGEVEVDLLVKDLNPAEFDDLQRKSSHNSIQSISSFDAVVFVGGSGCLANLDDEDSYEVARKTVSQNRVLAAICISSTILAKAGVLDGKKATVWSSPMDRDPIKILEQNGAIFEDKPVVIDGKIITGNGPDAAEEFGKTIIQVLTSI